MKLLFKQRLFSWLDSYDVYSEYSQPLYEVKGKLSFGHLLEIYSAAGEQVGTVEEKIFTFMPKFFFYDSQGNRGEIRKEFTFFKPSFQVDYEGWQVQGDIFEWSYQIVNGAGHCVASVEKQLLNFTDTYVIDVGRPEDELMALMVVLAIDAAKCSKD